MSAQNHLRREIEAHIYPDGYTEGEARMTVEKLLAIVLRERRLAVEEAMIQVSSIPSRLGGWGESLPRAS